MPESCAPAENTAYLFFRLCLLWVRFSPSQPREIKLPSPSSSSAIVTTHLANTVEEHKFELSEYSLTSDFTLSKCSVR